MERKWSIQHGRILIILISVLFFSFGCKSTPKRTAPLQDSSPVVIKDNPSAKKGNESQKVKVPPVSFNKVETNDGVVFDALSEIQTISLEEYRLGQHSLFKTALTNNILFETDVYQSHTLELSDMSQISDLFSSGKLGKFLYIVGHTDSRGTESYNLRLSLRRAMSVAIILVSNGVAPKKIKLVPAGEHLPIARNIEPFFDQNRRVEILSANSQALIQAFIRERDCTTIDSACKPTELGVVSIEKDKDFGVVIKADELSTVVSSRPSQGSLEQLATELTMIGGEGVDERVEFNSAHKRNALNATKIRKNVLQGTILRPPLSFKNAIRKALIFNTKYIIE